MPAPPTSEVDDSAHRYYDLPIPSLKAISDDYKRDDGDNEKYKRFEGGYILVVEDE